MDVSGIAQAINDYCRHWHQTGCRRCRTEESPGHPGVQRCALIEAIPPVPSAPNLPSHLGNTINTTA
jgi:hypothetical protein